MRALRLLTVAAGLLALTVVAGSSRAELQSATVPAAAIGAGLSNTCALTRAGGVECWGYNGEDQLGAGQGPDRFTPVVVSGLSSGVTAMAEGLRNACAIARGGGVKCWGAIYYGALGDGTTTRHGTPVDVAGLSRGAKAISAGSDDACAVTASGGVKCWGDNLRGQLGDGTTTDRPTPVDVSGLSSGVTAIASGADLRTCAIASGAQVVCWGRDRLTPAPVTGVGAEVKAITTDCALTAGGGVKCWGDDLKATDVPGLNQAVTAIASSGNHNCALTSLGAVKCWGLNTHGQLGDGTKTDRDAPVDVAGLPGPAVAIAAGTFHTCAVLRDGGAECWGANGAGQLGNGTDVDRSRPVAVKGLGVATATVAIVSRSIRVTRARVASVRLTCALAVRCHGSLELAAGSARLGSRAFSLAAGSRGAVAVKLTARGFGRLVRAKRLAAHVAVTGGVTAARNVTLVAPS